MSGLLAITWVLGVESTWVSVFRPSHLFARPDQKIAHNWAETEFWYFCVFVNLLVWICVLLCAYLFMNSSHLALWSPKPQDWSPEHNTGVLWMFWTMHVIQLKNCLGFIFLMTELWTSNQTYWECKCKLFSKKEECFPGCPTCSDGADVSFPPWGQKFHHKTRRVESCWLLCVKSWSNNSAYLARYTVFIFFVDLFLCLQLHFLWIFLLEGKECARYRLPLVLLSQSYYFITTKYLFNNQKEFFWH